MYTAGGAGFLGIDTANGYGVLGENTSTSGPPGIGVYGTSVNGSGVYGASTNYIGGNFSSSSTASTVAGVAGTVAGDGTGVYARSYGGYGVYSIEQGSGTTGYALYATSQHGTGLYATCGQSGCFAVYSAGNLQVAGTPYCSGCTAFTSNSDARLKQAIRPLAGALDTLTKLQGVSFEWRDPSSQGGHTGVQRGFIAQDVEQVLPEMVGVDSAGYKTLNLTGLESLVVESIKSLKAENDTLKARVNSLENSQPVNIESRWSTVLAVLFISLVLAVSGLAPAWRLVRGKPRAPRRAETST
jgi:hypothetical protein